MDKKSLIPKIFNFCLSALYITPVINLLNFPSSFLTEFVTAYQKKILEQDIQTIKKSFKKEKLKNDTQLTNEL